MTAEQPDHNDAIAIGMIAAELLGLPMPPIEGLPIEALQAVVYTLVGIASGFAATLDEAGYDPVGALQRISAAASPGRLN